VLYSTNTIHISSDVLVTNPCAFIPSPRRAQMTSLELRWRITDAWPAGIVPVFPSGQQQHPVFPSLKYLHLSLEKSINQLYGRKENGARVPFATAAEGLDALENVLLPLLDEAVQRYSPGGASCVVSLPWSYCQQLAGRFRDNNAISEDPSLGSSQFAFTRDIPSDKAHGGRREYLIRELGQVSSLSLA
jgi:hypothetical protein